MMQCLTIYILKQGKSRGLDGIDNEMHLYLSHVYLELLKLFNKIYLTQ